MSLNGECNFFTTSNIPGEVKILQVVGVSVGCYDLSDQGQKQSAFRGESQY